VRRDHVCRLGSWFLWGSLGALVGVVAILLVSPVIATASADAGEVMLNVLKAGFAVMAGAFLLGLACHLAEGLAGRPGGERRR